MYYTGCAPQAQLAAFVIACTGQCVQFCQTRLTVEDAGSATLRCVPALLFLGGGASQWHLGGAHRHPPAARAAHWLLAHVANSVLILLFAASGEIHQQKNLSNLGSLFSGD